MGKPPPEDQPATRNPQPATRNPQPATRQLLWTAVEMARVEHNRAQLTFDLLIREIPSGLPTTDGGLANPNVRGESAAGLFKAT